MLVHETPLAGVLEFHAEPHEDRRGAFARLYCIDEIAKAGVDFQVAQINISTNPARHTLRGMHFQAPPHAEAKFVRAVRGSAYDVALDLRPDSATYLAWHAVELDANKMNGLYLPKGIAHGFLTLAADTDIVYLMGSIFEPGHGAGARWNDPAFGIKWPAEPAVISDRDRDYADWAG